MTLPGIAQRMTALRRRAWRAVNCAITSARFVLVRRPLATSRHWPPSNRASTRPTGSPYCANMWHAKLIPMPTLLTVWPMLHRAPCRNGRAEAVLARNSPGNAMAGNSRLIWSSAWSSADGASGCDFDSNQQTRWHPASGHSPYSPQTARHAATQQERL